MNTLNKNKNVFMQSGLLNVLFIVNSIYFRWQTGGGNLLHNQWEQTGPFPQSGHGEMYHAVHGSIHPSRRKADCQSHGGSKVRHYKGKEVERNVIMV